MDLEIAKSFGCIVLRGNYIDGIAKSSPTSPAQQPKLPYHVTVFTKAEYQDFDDERKTEVEQFLRKPPSLTPPVDLGIGAQGPVTFNVIFWSQGDEIRALFGLPRKDFHITLSSKDNHDIEKGVNVITRCKTLTVEQVDQIISTCFTLASSPAETRSYVLDVVRFVARFHVSSLSEISFDKAWRVLFKLSYKAESSEFAFRYLESYPNSIAALLRAAHGCDMPQQAKQAMFMFAHAAHLLPDGESAIKTRCIEALVGCWRHTEFGPFFLDHEAEDWKNNRTLYSTYGGAFQDPRVRCLVRREVKNIMTDNDLALNLPSVASNQDVFTPLGGELYRLPRFFRWLAPFRLAVMSTPRSPEDIRALVALGITLVITLTEEGPLPAEWFLETPCRNLFLPVRNYQAPTNKQVDTFMKSMDDLPTEEAALIHCGGGKGRAGTFAACYLMARGYDDTPPQTNDSEEHIHMYPGDAMKLLRHLRPGSIETVKQETFVRSYAQYLTSGQKEDAPVATSLPESESPLEIEGKLPKSPSLVVCCGLPGSGKSTFASQLGTLGYTTISQDELGSKTACLNALSNAVENKDKIILDRCNPYVEDREQWLAHAFHPDNALCVWFDVDPEVCVRRADARTNHPTIASGRAQRIVQSFVKTFVPPTKKEKFACITRVPSSLAASDLLSRLGVSVKAVVPKDVNDKTNNDAVDGPSLATASEVPEKQFIHKFPRTRHLFNIGSASRDDLILSSSDAEAFLQSSDPSTTVVVEEKVDGANLGISLDSSGVFKVQNRSHYVNSKSHAQFKKLDKWLEDHYEDLSIALDAKGSQSGRWILYGEWLFAKHSIHYTDLPNMFLAFDLFDTKTKCFLSREALSERLKGTNIHQVREIEVEKADEQSLVHIVRSRQSSYYEGIVEGVYLRRQRDGKTIDRAKIVRSDFIAGDEHWNRRGVTPNIVMAYRW